MRYIFRVPEMDCPHESGMILDVWRPVLNGIEPAFDLTQRAVSVDLPEGSGVTAEDLLGLIRKTGLEAEILREQTAKPCLGRGLFEIPVMQKSPCGCGNCGTERSGSDDAPENESERVSDHCEEAVKVVFRIPDMDCPHESGMVTEAVKPVLGSTPKYDYAARAATAVLPSDGSVTAEKLLELIRGTGLEAEIGGIIMPNAAKSGKRIVFRIPDMDCPHESGMVTEAVKPAVGVTPKYDYAARTATVALPDDCQATAEQLLALIRKTGLEAEIAEVIDDAASDICPICGGRGCTKHIGLRKDTEIRTARRFTISRPCALSGICMAAAGALHLAGMEKISSILFICAAVIGAAPLLPKAWKSLMRLRPDMDLLMVIAVTGAVILGEYFEAAAVAFLFGVSNMLENWSADKASRSIEKLLDISAKTALVFKPGADPASSDYSEMPVESVPVGSSILIRPGDRVPLDGIISHGSGFVDESAVTGEAEPASKAAGDRVYAGAVNGDAALVMRSTAPYEDSTVARILRLVEEAQGSKAASVRWVDKFAAVYTPIMMGLALAVAIVPTLFGHPFARSCYDALVLLVVSCPCALVISTPAAVTAALAAAARAGVLFKGGAYLEMAGKMDTAVFDKTGTVTTGEFSVQEATSFSEMSEDEVLALAAALEARNSHPIASAICREAEKRGLTVPAVDDAANVPGKGASGSVSGRHCRVGSSRWLREELPSQTPTEDVPHAVYLWDEDALIGRIVAADTVRDEAAEAVRELRAAGIGNIVMLTGDVRQNAEPVAEKLGFTECRAGLMPQGKTSYVSEMTSAGHSVIMVGDGINDAPALAAASMGIAVGTGTDIAVESADCILMQSDLRRLPWLVSLSQRTLRIVRANIIGALGFKALIVILAACQVATLWMAVIADVGTTIVVTLNSLRLLKAK